jgi:acetyl esterase/lipase
LPGGGFVNPASNFLFEWLYGLTQYLAGQGHNVAIVALSYTLAPEAQHPWQLQQAVALLRHLLTVEKLEPANIILAGDSAGGHLVLGMISHILHAHTAIPALDLHGTPLRAALLISPWCDFDTARPAVAANRRSDYLSAATLARWARAYMGTAAADNYTHPARAPASWWTGVGAVVSRVLVWGGRGEALLDGVRDVALALEKQCTPGQGQVTTVITPGACHEEMILDIMMGYRDKGESQRAVELWLLETLQERKGGLA